MNHIKGKQSAILTRAFKPDASIQSVVNVRVKTNQSRHARKTVKTQGDEKAKKPVSEILRYPLVFLFFYQKLNVALLITLPLLL